MLRRLITRPLTWIVVAALVGAGAYWFQPWRAFTDTTVTETLSAPIPVPVAGSASGPVPATGSASGPVAAAPSAAVATVIRTGSFISHEHETAGTASLVRNPDGSHQLELAGLDTSDGPDLRVRLSDQKVLPGSAGWKVFSDGSWTELGRLKGNRGNQVYPIPAKVDPADYRSISIWCKRFAVSFGAAPLQ